LRHESALPGMLFPKRMKSGLRKANWAAIES
jgi:hypothetical protein